MPISEFARDAAVTGLVAGFILSIACIALGYDGALTALCASLAAVLGGIVGRTTKKEVKDVRSERTDDDDTNP